MIPTEKNLDMELELCYTRNGIWHTVTVRTDQMLVILRDGLFENRPVVAVKLWTITSDTHSVYLVHDIEAAKRGGQALDLSYADA